MKSNLKSYRVECMVCHHSHRVTSYVVDMRQWAEMYCSRCSTHTEHQRKD